MYEMVGSTPAWVEISVDKAGAGVYKEDPKEEDPLHFQLTDSPARPGIFFIHTSP